MTNCAAHSGDLGDILASLVAFRQVGGGEYILQPYPHRAGGPREPMTPTRANFLLPLIKAQPYITDARFEQVPENVTHDFTTLRFTTRKDDSQHSLADWHSNHLSITEPLDTSPWLKAEPLKEYAGKVVVARSKRYQNVDFPWTKILQKHKGNLLFVGTREEHHALHNRGRGAALPWVKCDDALHMARIIASASLVYANQSFPLWVALGLGAPFVAEVWRPSPDVRIPRANGRFIFGRNENAEFYRSL